MVQKKVGQWNRIDKYLLGMVFVLTTFLVVFLLMMFFIGSFEILSLLMLIYVLAIFLFMVIYAFCIYRQRKGMLLKNFNYDNATSIKVIENVLQQNKIRYRKLNKDKYISRFPLKYAEIFEIPDYQLFIKVQKQIATGSIIELGPINPTNEFNANNIKRIIDEAFQPKLL